MSVVNSAMNDDCLLWCGPMRRLISRLQRLKAMVTIGSEGVTFHEIVEIFDGQIEC